MIHALPHDVQELVWDAFKEGVHARLRERHRRLAATLLEQVDALCDHDAAARDFVLDWVAHMLKWPEHKPHKALVLVGRERCGKNALVALLSRLVPTLQTHDARRHVFGRYNAPMASARLVVLEDAAWRQSAGPIKSLICDTHLVVGGVYVEPSSHRVLMMADECPTDPTFHGRCVPVHCSGAQDLAAVLYEVLTTPGALDEVRALLLARPVGPSV